MPTILDFDPRRLPSDILVAIGAIIACATQSEQILEDAIGGCLGLDIEYAGALTTHMPMPLKFSILRSVAEIRIDDLDDLDKLDEILETLEKALAKRNEVAHHQIYRHPITNDAYQFKESARTRYELELVPLSVDQIKRDAMAIYDAGIALYTFIADRNLLPTIPSAPRPRQHKSKAARKKRRNVK